jgi:hypothetical protein
VNNIREYIVKRYSATTEIEVHTPVAGVEGYVEPNIGKQAVKKTFASKLMAERWIAKMTFLSERGIFLIDDDKERKSTVNEWEMSEFAHEVNKISNKLFGHDVYYVKGLEDIERYRNAEL